MLRPPPAHRDLFAGSKFPLVPSDSNTLWPQADPRTVSFSGQAAEKALLVGISVQPRGLSLGLGLKCMSLQGTIWFTTVCMYVFKKYLFVYFWLHQAFVAGHVILVAELRISHCATQTFLVARRLLCSWRVHAYLPQGMWDFSALTRGRTLVPCIGRQILNHWNTRDVPICIFLKEKIALVIMSTVGSLKESACSRKV